MGTMAGREVLTVEALAQGSELHPVQQAMVECAGSQCGYCTPGFVMSLFVAQQNQASADDAIEGNLCRCTGYQPIRAAAEQLARQPVAPDRFALGLNAARDPLQYAAMGGFFSPTTLQQALALKAQHPQSEWICGATDLGVDFGRGRNTQSIWIALDRIDALQRIQREPEGVRIGAAVCLSRIETELKDDYPALHQMLHWFAARQVRNRATLGGNLGTASPIGDLLPVLLALDATVELAGPQGVRTVPVAEFFLDYRKTQRRPEELIQSVLLPTPSGRTTASYKVAKRATDDISIVAAAFALQHDDAGVVVDARLAYGGVAAIPRRALVVEDFLRGRRLDGDTLQQAETMLRGEFTPLSDHRASAGYRSELCAALFAKFVAEHAA
jgi:xanthine dehydrogenase small subunit